MDGAEHLTSLESASLPGSCFHPLGCWVPAARPCPKEIADGAESTSEEDGAETLTFLASALLPGCCIHPLRCSVPAGRLRPGEIADGVTSTEEVVFAESTFDAVLAETDSTAGKVATAESTSDAEVAIAGATTEELVPDESTSEVDGAETLTSLASALLSGCCIHPLRCLEPAGRLRPSEIADGATSSEEVVTAEATYDAVLAETVSTAGKVATAESTSEAEVADAGATSEERDTTESATLTSLASALLPGCCIHHLRCMEPAVRFCGELATAEMMYLGTWGYRCNRNQLQPCCYNLDTWGYRCNETNGGCLLPTLLCSKLSSPDAMS